MQLLNEFQWCRYKVDFFDVISLATSKTNYILVSIDFVVQISLKI